MTKTERKARVEHKCCECSTVIAKGQKYQYLSGVWDGRGDSFKTCLPCAELREKATTQAYLLDYSEEWYPAFGELQHWVSEYESNEGEKFPA
jgi:hypothetical protein